MLLLHNRENKEQWFLLYHNKTEKLGPTYWSFIWYPCSNLIKTCYRYRTLLSDATVILAWLIKWQASLMSKEVLHLNTGKPIQGSAALEMFQNTTQVFYLIKFSHDMQAKSNSTVTSFVCIHHQLLLQCLPQNVLQHGRVCVATTRLLNHCEYRIAKYRFHVKQKVHKLCSDNYSYH